MKYNNIACYRFFALQGDLEEMRWPLKEKCLRLSLKGSILLSKQGINCFLSGSPEAIKEIKQVLQDTFGITDLIFKESLSESQPFNRMLVKVKQQIVPTDDSNIDPTNHTGPTISPQEFKRWMDEGREMLILDTRNDYEYRIGAFENSAHLDIKNFREYEKNLSQIDEKWKDKPVVMFCTGGIRCEKASAYYKHKGFKNVFQLEGGIINYVRQVEANDLENKFLGKNFVFDERRSERISDDVIANCHQCGKPADMHTNCANEACHLLFIQCDECKAQMENCCSTSCMEINRLPFEEQKVLRQR